MSQDALVAIAALLAPDEPDVADRVVHAYTDPDSYLRAHADQLDNRGIDEPIPELAWIALVDALADHGLLAEVDWKESADEIVAQLRGLRSSSAAVDRITITDLDTYEFLALAGDQLRAAGTALAVLDIESDCYPLVLLPAERATELVSLATTAGFTAGILSGEPY
ncbi:hypothetical protein LWC34_46295 [Kibdelosporangium philippinense]|uniref:DUF6630 domain-containing protein n=1 Tax=Kibdelosporangium philippinense TaxID=211113 RepID=A0ABS8ZU69_9PSEU|nr:DUF6630 family protein [Kibdelosporangium philippinense]MCE7010166.1 hypothetical protein [Kibdelosporangium philippinense]